MAVACGSSGQCDQKSFGGPFCVPDAGVAPAGVKLTLEIVDVCRAGCGSSNLSCTVSRDGGSIALGLAGEVCEPPPNVACTLACALTKHKCELPALEAGDYVVTSPDQSTQTLHVGDAGVTGCAASAF